MDWTLVSFSKSQDVQKNHLHHRWCQNFFTRSPGEHTHTHTHTQRHTHTRITAGKNKNLYLHWKNLKGAAERAPVRSFCCPARAAACFLAADTFCLRVSYLMKSRWRQAYWSVTEDSSSAALPLHPCCPNCKQTTHIITLFPQRKFILQHWIHPLKRKRCVVQPLQSGPNAEHDMKTVSVSFWWGNAEKWENWW